MVTCVPFLQLDPTLVEGERAEVLGSVEQEVVQADMGGMELDESINLDAMKRFVHSMGIEGSRHVTMDDIADEEQMKREDEEEDVRGPESGEEDGDDEDKGAPSDADAQHSRDEEDSEEDEEVEAVMRTEEGMLIGEDDTPLSRPETSRTMDGEVTASANREPDATDHGDSDEDDSEDDDDDEDEAEDETPRRGFQAELARLRESSTKDKGKGKTRANNDSSDEAMSVQMSWADQDDSWIAHIDVRVQCPVSSCLRLTIILEHRC